MPARDVQVEELWLELGKRMSGDQAKRRSAGRAIR